MHGSPRASRTIRCMPVGGDKEFPRQPRRLPGLMSSPVTAGLDPIFWLHHANIDRLWEVWRRGAASHVDPTIAKWADGPASLGRKSFVVPLPDQTPWEFTPGEMSKFSALTILMTILRRVTHPPSWPPVRRRCDRVTGVPKPREPWR